MTVEVLTLLVLDTLFVFFGTLAFVIALRISKSYNINTTSPQQYKLEKESYLGATVVKYIFFIKIALFLFFIFTLEKLALILPGAMCATGVVNASEYGISLFILKVINLYLFAYWLFLHKEDMKNERTPYMRLKFQIFIPLYFLLIGEIFLELLFFFSIDFEAVVDCCGVIFSSSDGTYLAALLGTAFWLQALALYGALFLMFVSFMARNARVFALLNLLFVFLALVALIGAFSPYIYELPTHRCPFCLLAHDYNYIGYLLYALLFFGTFSGGVLGFFRLTKREERAYFVLSLVCNSLYSFILGAYVLLYYLKNSVLL